MKKAHKKNSRHVAGLRSRSATSARKSPKYVSRNRENSSGVGTALRHQTFDVDLGNDTSADLNFAPIVTGNQLHRPQGK